VELANGDPLEARVGEPALCDRSLHPLRSGLCACETGGPHLDDGERPLDVRFDGV
jgi:hypothetical protein